jgi:hypothetical protein
MELTAKKTTKTARNLKFIGTPFAIALMSYFTHFLRGDRMKLGTLLILALSLNIAVANDAQRLPNKPHQKYLKAETKKAARATRTTKIEGIESKTTNNIGSSAKDDSEPSLSSSGVTEDTARATGVGAKNSSSRSMSRNTSKNQKTDCSNLANKAQENCVKADKVRK